MIEASWSKIFKSILLFIIIVSVGILGFMIIEGWNLIDAVYMTIITIATVGYGEIHPLTDEGRIFTIFLIVGGLGSAAAVLNSLVSLVLDNKLNTFLGRKNMNVALKKMENHVILCGFNQIGLIIAIKLQEKEIPFVIITSDKLELENINQLGFIYVDGEITSDSSLLTAGIKRAKTIVACISDITLNLTISLAAKELNSDIKVIAQGLDRNIESRILRAGADKVVYPLALGGEQISEIIAENYNIANKSKDKSEQVIDGYFIKMYKYFGDETVTIGQLIEKERAINCIAYKPKDSQIVENPYKDTLVYKDEYILILLNEDSYNKEVEDVIEYKGIEWSSEYSVGISSIDEEHLRLINLINKLNEGISKKESKNMLEPIFDQLIEYTLEHFKNEEELMKNSNYAELEEHKIEHKKLMQTVMDLNKEKFYIFPQNVSEFLNSWLINHILNCDIKYKGQI